MNSFNKTLLAMLLGVALSACSKKQEEPVVSVDAPKAPVAAEVKKEPVKEEPGGWVPPPAESEAAAIAEPPVPVTPPVSAPTEKAK